MIIGTPPIADQERSVDLYPLVVFLAILCSPILTRALVIWWVGLRALMRRGSLQPTPITTLPTMTGCGCSPVEESRLKSLEQVEGDMGTPASLTVCSRWGSGIGRRLKSLLHLLFVLYGIPPP